MLVFFAILFSYISPAMNFFDAWRGSHTTDARLQSLQHNFALDMNWLPATDRVAPNEESATVNFHHS